MTIEKQNNHWDAFYICDDLCEKLSEATFDFIEKNNQETSFSAGVLYGLEKATEIVKNYRKEVFNERSN